MESLRNAAIIILTMGEECAAEILKEMSQKEVEAIIDMMSNMGDISERELIEALNEFFSEANNTSGINISSNAYIRKTFLSAVGLDKATTVFDESEMSGQLAGIELLKWQPIHVLVDALEEEHPQMVTVALMCMENEKSAQILSLLPKTLSNEVIHRMTQLTPVSSYGMRTLSEYLEDHFTKSDKFKIITSDGIDKAANIISYMASPVENQVLRFLTEQNQEAYERIQDKLFPFERLAKLDSRSLQTLLAEINNDDLLLALKGATETVKNAFFKNMSNKTVSLLKDDLESMGHKKASDLTDAQKRMVNTAKKLAEQQKIILPSLRGGKQTA